jgi:hypothetical protein
MAGGRRKCKCCRHKLFRPGRCSRLAGLAVHSRWQSLRLHRRAWHSARPRRLRQDVRNGGRARRPRSPAVSSSRPAARRRSCAGEQWSRQRLSATGDHGPQGCSQHQYLRAGRCRLDQGALGLILSRGAGLFFYCCCGVKAIVEADLGQGSCSVSYLT